MMVYNHEEMLQGVLGSPAGPNMTTFWPRVPFCFHLYLFLKLLRSGFTRENIDNECLLNVFITFVVIRFFICPTGRRRVCKIWFVNTGKNRGKSCPECKKRYVSLCDNSGFDTDIFVTVAEETRASLRYQRIKYAPLGDSSEYDALLSAHSRWEGSVWYEPRHEKSCYATCEQQRRRSACVSAQSDQRLYCSLPR